MINHLRQPIKEHSRNKFQAIKEKSAQSDLSYRDPLYGRLPEQKVRSGVLGENVIEMLKFQFHNEEEDILNNLK